jgi:hypothetical protein
MSGNNCVAAWKRPAQVVWTASPRKSNARPIEPFEETALFPTAGLSIDSGAAILNPCGERANLRALAGQTIRRKIVKQARIRHAGDQGRLDGLKRAEQDLRERVSVRISALERAGRWHLSDPLYQRLWFALASVREHLRSAREGAA